MEYYKRNLSEKYRNSESPRYYDKKSSLQTKESLFKEAYSCMYQFNKMFYEAKRESKHREII